LKCIVYNINHSKFDAKEKWSLICIQFRYVHIDKVFNAFYHQLSDKINGQKSSVISINSDEVQQLFSTFPLFIHFYSIVCSNEPDVCYSIWLPIMFICLIMHPPCLCTQMHFFYHCLASSKEYTMVHCICIYNTIIYQWIFLSTLPIY
jgi:hypothetical protein